MTLRVLSALHESISVQFGHRPACHVIPAGRTGGHRCGLCHWSASGVPGDPKRTVTSSAVTANDEVVDLLVGGVCPCPEILKKFEPKTAQKRSDNIDW